MWTVPLAIVSAPGARARPRRRARAAASRIGPAFERIEPRTLLSGPPIAASIDSLGFGANSGWINPVAVGQPAQVDVYQYDAPVSQMLDVRVEAQGTLESASLSILAPGGSLLLSASGQIGQPITEVRFPVVAGTSYDFAVSAGAASFTTGLSGPYRLVFDDFSDQFSAAYPIAIAPGATAAAQDGAIDPAGDADWFQFTAPMTGFLAADLAAAPGDPLAPALLVEDATGREFAGDPDRAASADARVSGFAVVQGQTYHVLASSSIAAQPSQRVGRYALSLSFTAPAVGHSPGTATPLPASPNGGASASGLIQAAGVADYYRYVAPVSTTLVIREESPAGSPLDTLLTTADASGNPLPGGVSDDATWGDDHGGFHRGSQVRVPVIAGQTYLIEAGAFGASTGAYQLSVLADGAGPTLETAVQLTLPAAGPIVQAGTILFPGDVHFDSFVAPTSGEVTAEQDMAAYSNLDSLLTVYDASRYLLAFDDDSDPAVTGDPRNSLLRFPIVAGQTYYVESAAFPNLDGIDQTGDYRLTLTTDPNPPPDTRPDTFANAASVNLGTGFARLSGSIDTGDVVAIYRFTAHADESIQVGLDPSASGGFQGDLYAFDAAGNVLADDHNLGLLQGRTSGAIRFDVVTGQAYFVQVAVNRGHVGAYDLRFAAAPTIPPASDGYGQTFADATPIALDPTDAATVGGSIDQTGAQDVFAFRAAATADLTIRLVAAPGSRLDPLLSVFTDSQSPIGSSDDSDLTLDPDGSLGHIIDRDSALLLPVVAGKTYYLKAASAGSSTGAYFLALSSARAEFGYQIGDAYPPVDFNDPVQPLPVQPIALDAAGGATQGGALVMPGDLNAFQFTATTTGLLTVQEQAAPGSGLDSDLYAFDGSREPLADNNDFNGTYNSLVQFNVEAGQTYYLKAGGYGTSNGAYVLTLSLQPLAAAPGRSFATAVPMSVSATASTAQDGQIVAAGDAVFYRFIAPASGSIAVREQAAAGSPLDSYLYAFDGSQPVNNFDGLQGLLASDDDSGGTLDSLVQFDVTAGQPYYLRAAGFGTSTGGYVLTVSYVGTSPAPPPGRGFAEAIPIAIDSKLLSATVFGTIGAPGDADVYRFVAPVTGPIVVTQQAVGGGALDSYLFLYDDSQTLIGSDDDQTIDPTAPGGGIAIPDSLVQANVVAGRTYYIRAASSTAHAGDPTRSPTGDYRVQVAFPAYDFGATFADARTIPPPGPGPSVQAGAILQPGEVDMFQFAATAAGRVTFQVAANPGLVPLLIGYDAQGNEIARGPSSLSLGLQAGSLRFVQVGGYGVSTGGFQLTYQEIPGIGLGLDFGSAIPVGLSSSGSAAVDAVLGPAGDFGVFQFRAPATGQATLTQASGSGVALRAFTYQDGTSTQVAGGDGGSLGPLTFAVAAGQTYYIRATSMGAGGPYRLAIQATGAEEPPDLQVSGKATFVTLGTVFTVAIPATGPGGTPPTIAAAQITAALLAEFVRRQAPLSGVYVLIWADPVDLILTDAQARQDGYTADRGKVSETPGAYNSGGGVLQLVIAPFTGGSYDLALFGVGEGPVLFGAALIAADGTASAPQSGTATTQPVILGSQAEISLVLDFNDSVPQTSSAVETGTVADGGTSGGTATHGAEASSPVEAAAAAASGGFFGAGTVLFGSALLILTGLDGEAGANVADASATAAAPSGVTTLVGPAHPGTSPGISSNDELPPPPEPALARIGPLAPLEELVAPVHEAVQPLARGFGTLTGHLRALFRSIAAILAPARPAAAQAARAVDEVADRTDLLPAGPPSPPATARATDDPPPMALPDRGAALLFLAAALGSGLRPTRSARRDPRLRDGPGPIRPVLVVRDDLAAADRPPRRGGHTPFSGGSTAWPGE